jgi:hypothetical protein
MKSKLDYITTATRPSQLAWHLVKPITLALVTLIGSSLPAQAVTFNLNFAPGTTQQQIVGIKMATDIWSRYLVDDSIVNLYIGMTNQGLGTGVLGAATPGLVSNMSYTNFYNSINSDKTSILDTLAVASLPNASSYNFRMNGTPYTNNKLITTTANAKSLGINTNGATNNYGGIDGYIQFDPTRSWSYDYTRSGSIQSTQYDFLSTAIHEIGHTLGFISSVDQPYDPVSKTIRATPLDLFRYATNTSGVTAVDLSTNVQPYFYGNGTGSITSAGFSSGANGTPQASHWQVTTSPLGIMLGEQKAGVRYNVTALDLIGFDAIGYNVGTQSLVDITTTSTFLSNLQTTATTYATTAIVIDRSADVQNMKNDSITYSWGWSGYKEEAHEDETTSVPEPSSVFGLLGMAIFGVRSLVKKRLCQN